MFNDCVLSVRQVYVRVCERREKYEWLPTWEGNYLYQPPALAGPNLPFSFSFLRRKKIQCCGLHEWMIMMMMMMTIIMTDGSWTDERTNEQRTKEAQTAGPPLPFDRSSMLEATCKGRRNLMAEGSLFAITTPLLKMMSESKFGWRQIFWRRFAQVTTSKFRYFRGSSIN